MDIRDISYDNIVSFLEANQISSVNKDVDYKKAREIMKNSDTNYEGVNISIIKWMMAHNLLISDVKISYYDISEILELNENETNNLARLLGMESNDKHNIIDILRFAGKLSDGLETTVINLKGKKAEWGSQLENAPNNVIYMGRRFNMGGWNLKESEFSNPFAINKNLTREDAIEQYKVYILDKLEKEPELKEKLKSYKGKILACWCTPDCCHTDLLRELIEGKRLGNVVCGTKPGRGKGAYPIVYSPNGSEYINIPAYSRGAAPWNSLSPFFIKPAIFNEIMFNGDIIERDVTCIENYWQSTKVEAKYSREKEGLPPKEEWWVRRNKIWSDPEAHRHVIEKKDRTHPSEGRHYWNGKYISYEDARKEIYINSYWKAAEQTKAFKDLVDMRNRGVNFQIIGPDGRNIDKNLGLKGELADITKPFGHELVLVAMLTMNSIDELL